MSIEFITLATIRALICETPEASDLTSIKQRLQAYQEKAADNQHTSSPQTSAIKTNRETSEHDPLNALVG